MSYSFQTFTALQVLTAAQMNSLMQSVRDHQHGVDSGVSATLGAITISGAITYGGVALTNAVTGTGKMVLDTGPTLASAILTGGVGEAYRAAAYRWTDYDPSASGVVTTAPNTAAATLSAPSYITMSNSSGTVTFQFDKAGVYMVNLYQANKRSAACSQVDHYFNLGGSANRIDSVASQIIGYTGDNARSISKSFIVVATAGQTLTVQPQVAVTSGNAMSNFTTSVNAVCTYMGDR